MKSPAKGPSLTRNVPAGKTGQESSAPNRGPGFAQAFSIAFTTSFIWFSDYFRATLKAIIR